MVKWDSALVGPKDGVAVGLFSRLLEPNGSLVKPDCALMRLNGVRVELDGDLGTLWWSSETLLW